MVIQIQTSILKLSTIDFWITWSADDPLNMLLKIGPGGNTVNFFGGRGGLGVSSTKKYNQNYDQALIKSIWKLLSI